MRRDIGDRRCWRCLAKARRIICEQLASLLRVVKKATPRADDAERNDRDVILDDGFLNRVEVQPPKTGASSDPVLIDIRELLQKTARLQEEERIRARNDSRMKQEWMLVALVVNRLCFIFFTSTLVTVNVVFFLVFRMHH